MKKIMAVIIAASSLFFLTVSNTFAEWSVGFSVNKGEYEASGTELEDGELNTSKTEKGEFTYPSVFVEYKTGMASVGIDYIPGEVVTEEQARTDTGVGDSSLTTGNDTNVTNKAKVGFSQHVTLYALAPIMETGAFVRAGVIRVNINTKETLGTGSTYPDTHVFGGSLSLGYQHDAAEVFFRAEIGRTVYEEISVTSSFGHKVDADVQGNWARLSIGKTF